jgi:hypothetical protein
MARRNSPAAAAAMALPLALLLLLLPGPARAAPAKAEEDNPLSCTCTDVDPRTTFIEPAQFTCWCAVNGLGAAAGEGPRAEARPRRLLPRPACLRAPGAEVVGAPPVDRCACARPAG